MVERLLECVMRSEVEMLYVVDNAPSREMAGLFEGLSRATYIANGRNLGYGRAHNIAMKLALEAGASYHLVLNPDIYWDVETDVPARLREFMEETPSCGLAMPKVLWPDGSVQPLCKLLPRPADLIRRRFMPAGSRYSRQNRRFELHASGYNKVMEVPSLSGCFMFLRCSALRRAGMFDPRFFLYAEDVDLCRRIGLVADTLFVHHVSVVHEYQRGSYKSLRLLFHHIVSCVRYFNKWGWVNDPVRDEVNGRCMAQLPSSRAEQPEFGTASPAGSL